MDKQTALEIGQLANKLYIIEEQLNSMKSNDFIRISVHDHYSSNVKAFLQIEGNHKILHDLKDKVIKNLQTQKDALKKKLLKF
jgi:hypothetical protein